MRVAILQPSLSPNPGVTNNRSSGENEKQKRRIGVNRTHTNTQNVPCCKQISSFSFLDSAHKQTTLVYCRITKRGKERRKTEALSVLLGINYDSSKLPAHQCLNKPRRGDKDCRVFVLEDLSMLTLGGLTAI